MTKKSGGDRISMNTEWTKGRIFRYAGTGTAGYGGDGQKADTAELNGPAGLACDRQDNLYVAEIFNSVVRKINAATGIITTVAGCGLSGFAGDGGPAVNARLNGPEGVFVTVGGDIYIADTCNERIRMVDAGTGIIRTITGTGEAGYNGDGMDARRARLNHPSGIVVDSKGNVYFGDYRNDRIRKVDTDGMISTYAGTGVHGYSGDGGPAVEAEINDVYGMAIDREDNVYLIDSLNFAVRKIDARTGGISTVVGKGKPGPVTEFTRPEDGYIGGTAYDKGTIGMEVPHAVEADVQGNVFIADTASCRIRMFDRKRNRVYTVAGNGRRGCSGDNGPALEACLDVHGLRMDSRGNLYFLDFHNHIIRVVRFNE